MNANAQNEALQAAISAAPEGVSIRDAIRNLHSEYIRRQINNKGINGVPGLLIAAGLVEDENPPDGWLRPNHRYHRIFEEFLGMRGKLTGAKGKTLRGVMDRFGIDYYNSPTHPLEPLDKSAA